jgi:hypothetical protein
VPNSSSPSSSTGAGAGKAQFSPLTVDIHSLTGLASLFGDAASGHVIPAVQLVGVETIKGQSQTVYDIKLSDVSVGGFENDPGPNGVETALAFNFARISVTDRPQQPNGSLGVPQTATFDLKENATDATLAASNIASTAVATDAVSLASAATPVPASSPLHYFLKVDGVTGTTSGFSGGRQLGDAVGARAEGARVWLCSVPLEPEHALGYLRHFLACFLRTANRRPFAGTCARKTRECVMSDWGRATTPGTAFTLGFYSELAPNHLEAALLLAGFTSN